jgi:hypothetical protein
MLSFVRWHYIDERHGAQAVMCSSGGKSARIILRSLMYTYADVLYTAMAEENKSVINTTI